MSNNKIIKPANEEEKEMLDAMQTYDFRIDHSTHTPVLKFWDLIPLHYMVISVAIIYIVCFFLKIDIIKLILSASPFFMVIFIVSLYYANYFNKKVFEVGFSNARKTSFSREIRDPSYIVNYRFSVRISALCVWFEVCGLWFVVCDFYLV